MSRRFITALSCVAFLALAACESSEEKAEGFYQSGLELLASGDPDRAAVSFQNVFRYNGEHQDARRQLAEILINRGDASGGYSQYLRLAEQYPEISDIRQALARLAIQLQNWDEAERHGRRAITLAPDDTLSQAIRVALDYRQAALDNDRATAETLAGEARAFVDADPTDIMSRRIVIAEAISQGRGASALDDIDIAIQQFPEDLSYYVIKLRTLTQLQDMAALETHLKVMYQQFPENEDVQRTLISFYMQRQDFDGAESFLRDLAGDETGDPGGFVPILQLIERAQGRDAARAELNRLRDVNADNPANAQFYRALLASYTYDDGDRNTAIAELEAILETAEPGDQTRRIKGTLATMLLSTGNQVGSRAVIEDILTEDASDATALKLRAQMLIDADNPRDAIIDLRRALDQNPRDTSIILLLAAAHERDGATELQGERLATAVEVSNSAPRESLLYADFLIRQNRSDAARSVLSDARNANPRNIEILAQASRLALADNAAGVVRGIIADLERMPEEPRAPALVNSLRSALLLQEDRVDEGLSLLQQQAGEEGENANAVFAIVQTQLRAGKLDEARAYLDGLLENAPDSVNLRLIDAALNVAEGDTAASEQILRGIVAENPGAVPAVSQLYVQLRRTGDIPGARAVLEAGVAATPEAGQLLLYQAGELEQTGDVEGAIAIYEQLYERNSGNIVVANNLASLLTTFRDTPEGLERAAAVARRLRDTEIPAFQDTYGWIAYRLGRFDEAVRYLESAAQGLPNNPLAHFHLGMTYVAVERPNEARAALTRAIEIAGDDSTLPQMQTAREALETLNAN